MKEYLYFTGTWCGACRMLGPTMNSLQQEGMSVRKIDVDTNSELAAQYHVRNITTLILENNGIEVNRKVGNNPKESYINLWNQ